MVTPRPDQGHTKDSAARDRSKVEEGDRRIVEAMLRHTRPVESAAMTRNERTLLRHLIDQAKRRQLAARKETPHRPPRDPARRRASYAAYYWKHREEIRARRNKKRAA